MGSWETEKLEALEDEKFRRWEIKRIRSWKVLILPTSHPPIFLTSNSIV